MKLLISSILKLGVIPMFLLYFTSCQQSAKQEIASETAEASTSNTVEYEVTGSLESLDPIFNSLVAEDAKIEILASGFNWSEGPVWLESENMLLFSDVPENIVYSWKPGTNKAEIYLQPSGFTGEVARGGESGSNGLALDNDGKLVLCQHGDRQLGKMLSPFSAPAAEFEAIADNWEGKKFNSPNDVTIASNGTYYFTDPPYGLAPPPEGHKGENPNREIPFQGVYSVKNGEVKLQTKELSRPNGIALSLDESKVYVANSDGKNPIWMVYDLDENGDFTNGKVFFDATELGKTRKGSQDGLKVHKSGNIFATGPGGVLVFSPEGKHLGSILTGQATANCGFSADGNTLYMTADMHLMRIQLKESM